MRERSGHQAYASATARHVSSDGCQLVLDDDSISKGQRFTFAIEGEAPVCGAVRWVVGDRAGFAFDSPIGKATMHALERGSRRAGNLDLYLMASAEASG